MKNTTIKTNPWAISIAWDHKYEKYVAGKEHSINDYVLTTATALVKIISRINFISPLQVLGQVNSVPKQRLDECRASFVHVMKKEFPHLIDITIAQFLGIKCEEVATALLLHEKCQLVRGRFYLNHLARIEFALEKEVPKEEWLARVNKMPSEPFSFPTELDSSKLNLFTPENFLNLVLFSAEEFFGVNREVVAGPCRKTEILRVRYMVIARMFVGYKVMKLPYVLIGKKVNRKHPAIVCSKKRHTKLLAKDKEYRHLYARFSAFHITYLKSNIFYSFEDVKNLLQEKGYSKRKTAAVKETILSEILQRVAISSHFISDICQKCN